MVTSGTPMTSRMSALVDYQDMAPNSLAPLTASHWSSRRPCATRIMLARRLRCFGQSGTAVPRTGVAVANVPLLRRATRSL